MEKSEVYKIFSSGLSNFMDRKGYKSKEIAKILGITDASASTMANGKTLPRFEKVYTLVEKGMTLEEIFGADLAKKLMESYKTEGADVENIDIFKELPSPVGMTEDEFDRKLKGSLQRLLGHFDIK